MKCFECQGELREGKVTLHLQKNGKPVILEKVPARVCQPCGEEYLSGLVAEKVGLLLEKDWKPETVLSVPVISYREAALA